MLEICALSHCIKIPPSRSLEILGKEVLVDVKKREQCIMSLRYESEEMIYVFKYGKIPTSCRHHAGEYL